MKKYILIMLLILSSCNTSDDKNEFNPILPPITQTGENTFGCYIDGILLTPRDGTGTILGDDDGMYFLSGPSPDNIQYNEINVHDFKGNSKGILKLHFTNIDLLGEGTFIINQSNCQDGLDANININITCRLWNEQTQLFDWYCSTENGGVIEILNYQNSVDRIISATFNCLVQNRNNSDDIIEITDGRFDINTTTLRYEVFP